MSYSGTASLRTAAAPYQPIPQPPPAPPSVEASSTGVLITEQEVLFGTAAVVLPKREGITRRFDVSRPSRPRRRDYPRRYQFLERSLMGREMDRL
jgi:hypothetical protein